MVLGMANASPRIEAAKPAREQMRIAGVMKVETMQVIFDRGFRLMCGGALASLSGLAFLTLAARLAGGDAPAMILALFFWVKCGWLLPFAAIGGCALVQSGLRDLPLPWLLASRLVEGKMPVERKMESSL